MFIYSGLPKYKYKKVGMKAKVLKYEYHNQ